MITLFGTLIGLFGSMIPDLFKLLRDHQDRRHELTLLQLQIEQQRIGASERLDEIRIKAEANESQALYRTWKSDIGWVDALNGTVRPVLAYSFFLLYFTIKCMQFSLIAWESPLPWQLHGLWNEEDQAIFVGIIAFYFGQRAMGKVRSGR